MSIKKIGFIGIGKMGYYLAQRILNSGIKILAYDLERNNILKIVEKGAEGCESIEEIAEKLDNPKIILICVPAGNVDEILEKLDSLISDGDTIIDLGNSYYSHSQRRAKSLEERNIDFIDVGISGGIEGARDGACLMIGGNEEKVSQLNPIFEALSKDGSYKFLGKSGSGHLVKGYHNMIEYGFLQSLAEGLESIYEVSKKEGMKIKPEEICDIWNKGSIIESRIVLDAYKAFQKSPTLDGIEGGVYGQTLDKIKKLIQIAKDCGVEIYSCEAALKARIDSQSKPTYSGKVINAIRNIFGGHEDWKK